MGKRTKRDAMQMTAIFTLLTSAFLAASESRIPASRCLTSEQLKLVDYDTFGKLDLQERLIAYQSMSPANRAELTKTHAQRWLDRYRKSLLPSDIAAIQEQISWLGPDHFLSDDPDKRANPAEARMPSVYIPSALDVNARYLPPLAPTEAQAETVFNEAPLPTDPVQRAHRLERNRNYNQNVPPGFREPLADSGSRVLHVDRFVMPPFHWFSACTLVVRGDVEDEQPYLSEDGSVIYTEFGLRIGDIIKNDPLDPKLQGERIAMERWGGALRLPSGKIITYLVSGDGIPPRLGARYLVLLGKEGGAFKILEGYEFREGFVFPLKSTNPHAPVSEKEFLEALFQAAKR
jgi:hypothetical protein